MKKKTLWIIIASTCAVIAVAVGAFLFLSRNQTPAEIFTIDSVIPQGPFMYVHVKDVKKNVDLISESDIGKALYSLDFQKLYDNKVINKSQMEMIEYLKKNVPDFIESLIFEKFFSREIVWAVYKTKVGFDSVATLEDANVKQLADLLSSGMFLVTRIPLEAQVMESFIDLFAKQFQGVSMSGEEYKGYTVRVLKFKNANVRVSFIKIKDYLVIGLGDQAAKLSIDTYEGFQSSVNQDKSFQKIKAKALNPHSFLFHVDINFLFTTLKSQMVASMDVFNLSQEEQLEAFKKIKEAFSKVVSFHHFNLSVDLQKTEPSKVSAQFFYDEESMPEELADFYQCPATLNKTAKFIPKDAWAYQWNNCIGFNNIWKGIKEERLAKNQDPSTDQKNAMMVDLLEKGVLSALSDEMGGFVMGIKKGNILPIPQMALFIKVAKEKVITSLLEKLNDSPLFFVRLADYQGINYHYVVFPMKILAEPSYCFLDDYLVVAINQKILKQAIDAYKDPSVAIVTDKDFSRKDWALGAKNRGVQFFRIQELTSAAEKTIEWREQSAADKAKREAAFLSGKKKLIEERKQTLKAKEEKLTAMEKEKESLESSLKSLTPQQKEEQGIQASLDEVSQQIEDYNLMIEEDGDYIAKQEAFMEKYQTQKQNSQQKVFIDNVVIPLTKAMKSVTTLATKTDIHKGVFQILLFFK